MYRCTPPVVWSTTSIATTTATNEQPPPPLPLYLVSDDEDSAASAKSFEEVSRRLHVPAIRGITIKGEEREREREREIEGDRERRERGKREREKEREREKGKEASSESPRSSRRVVERIFFPFSFFPFSRNLIIAARFLKFDTLHDRLLRVFSFIISTVCSSGARENALRSDRRRMSMDETHGGGMVSAILSSIVLLLLLGRTVDAQ